MFKNVSQMMIALSFAMPNQINAILAEGFKANTQKGTTRPKPSGAAKAKRESARRRNIEKRKSSR